MRAFVGGQAGSAELLRTALHAVAEEGRRRELRPEELVIALRNLELRIDTLASKTEDERAQLRARMNSAMLRAYYS